MSELFNFLQAVKRRIETAPYRDDRPPIRIPHPYFERQLLLSPPPAEREPIPSGLCGVFGCIFLYGHRGLHSWAQRRRVRIRP